MKRFDHLLAALCIAALPLPCMGVDNLQFSGILLAPPVCQVSDQGGRLEVRFKSNIAISRIDGERYRQAIPYQIECPGAGNTPVTWHMRLTLKGAYAHFDSSALKTSELDLGIRVLLGGIALIPNEPREIDFNTSALPTLEAVPVKLTGSALSSTEFTASALLMAELY